MLSSSLRTLLVALVAAVSVAPAVSATPCLTVKASVPEFTIQLLGFKNLNVTTTVANTGSKTLKLLHDPRSVLSNFPSDAFIITNSAGPSPPFKGVTVSYASGCMMGPRSDILGLRPQIKWSPTHAASLNDPSVFVILNPGQSIDVVHDREWIIPISLATRRIS